MSDVMLAPTPFTRYAAWYDAFNGQKDYASEAAYVLSQVERLRSRPQRWLDIGCGTGHHAASLSSLGLTIEGLDRSVTMIERARASYPTIPFQVGPVELLDGPESFDVISMLFHALNYVTTSDALDAALVRIAHRLTPNGVFVFDFWHLDAVRRDPPGHRVRTATIEGRPMVRLTTSRFESDSGLVEVDFEFRWDSVEGELVHGERHIMRPFAVTELAVSLKRAGLTVTACDAWMQQRALTATDWYGFICAEPIGASAQDSARRGRS